MLECLSVCRCSLLVVDMRWWWSWCWWWWCWWWWDEMIMMMMMGFTRAGQIQGSLVSEALGRSTAMVPIMKERERDRMIMNNIVIQHVYCWTWRRNGKSSMCYNWSNCLSPPLSPPLGAINWSNHFNLLINQTDTCVNDWSFALCRPKPTG